MGFHKRYIDEEGILSVYRLNGISGLKRYFSADALIIRDTFAREIHDYIVKAKGNDEWDRLEDKLNTHIKDVESA
jgi:hypothetical protein